MFVLHLINWLLNLPVQRVVSWNLGDFWTLVLLLGWLYVVSVAVSLAVLCIVILMRVLPLFAIALLRRAAKGTGRERGQAFLELTFPAVTAKSAYATEQLHILLRSQFDYYGFVDKLAGRKERYSFELVGTRDDGIRYVLVVPGYEAERMRRSLLSYLPGIKIRQISDYLDGARLASARAVELQLSADFVLPLREHKLLEEHDPFAYLTGHMAKLAPGELVAAQIVATPIRRYSHLRAVWHMGRIRMAIASGKELSGKVHRSFRAKIVVCILLPLVIFEAAMRTLGALLAIFAGSDHYDSALGKTPTDMRSPVDPYEQELAGLIKAKLDQHLYEVSIRVLVASDDPETITQRLNSLIAAYDTFDSPWQSIVTQRYWPLFKRQQDLRRLDRFRKRELTPHILAYGSIVSDSELADLYHFPNTDTTKTEGLVKSRSRELAAPLSIKRSDATFDVVVGKNTFGGEEVPIGLSLEQRRKHMYVIGKTGTGKTTLLTSMIYQDMVNGKGLAVLDPHGDMFRQLLEIVPEERRDDVIVFDPSDRKWPLGLNMLDPGVKFARKDDRHEWTASAIVSVFEKLADEKQWGPRMEHILRNAVLTALQLPNPNLYTLQRLLTEKSYQREVAKGLKDPILKQFWSKELKLLGTMQLSNAVSPLTHRLGHFITTKMSRHILLQDKSTLRMADIMNEGKILLVNLSKGDLGEDQSSFFGTILTSLIWMAAYQRTKMPEDKRRDFFLYVDEFQNFATKRFTEITSEGRKFRVSLIASHQNIAQIEDQSILKTIAGNAHSMICLKASPDDEDFILPFMKPEVERGDIVNLAPYHFYMKTTADESEDAFSGITVPLVAGTPSITSSAVIANSRKLYGTPIKTVEASLAKALKQKLPTVHRGSDPKHQGSSRQPAAKKARGLVEG